MVDREKVIKGLEICTSNPCYCAGCPYRPDCCLDSQEVMEDALTLLKDQETISETDAGKPVKQMDEIERIETEERFIEAMIDLWILPDAPEWIVNYARQELRKQRGLLEEKVSEWTGRMLSDT